MTAVYNLVRCSDGKTVFSFPAGGRYLVDTSNGLQSMRPSWTTRSFSRWRVPRAF